MKPIIFIILAILAFSNCTSETTTEETKENLQNEEIQDTLNPPNEEIITKDENANQNVDYSMIEHYALLDTKEKLEAKFDKSHLQDGYSLYAEGTVELPHTILTNPKNGHVVKYVWKESAPNELGSVEVSYFLWNEDYEKTGSQKISSECGFYTGMSLKDLRDWNGKDFMFSGFGWDYAGGIFAQPDTKIYDCKTKITLDLDAGDNYHIFDFLLGDIELSTKDGAVLETPILVAELILYL